MNSWFSFEEGGQGRYFIYIHTVIYTCIHNIHIYIYAFVAFVFT
jgi:hypothetical protein